MLAAYAGIVYCVYMTEIPTVPDYELFSDEHRLVQDFHAYVRSVNTAEREHASTAQEGCSVQLEEAALCFGVTPENLRCIAKVAFGLGKNDSGNFTLTLISGTKSDVKHFIGLASAVGINQDLIALRLIGSAEAH